MELNTKAIGLGFVGLLLSLAVVGAAYTLLIGKDGVDAIKRGENPIDILDQKRSARQSLPVINGVKKTSRIIISPSLSYPLCSNNKEDLREIVKAEYPIKYTLLGMTKHDKNGKLIKVKYDEKGAVVGTTVLSNICRDNNGSVMIDIVVKAKHLIGFKSFDLKI